ncbi:MAG: formylmethanofuran dehydrogenase subunit E family protein [Deltaproteobacteria bacterium]|nr:formylmethanofuran dehydrogenase subunit E family protein [Deltaproteobacteria bacterium]
MEINTVCKKSVEEFIGIIEKFHGWAAPGVVIGGFMVDWAQELLGQGIEADAIVETRHCLPDAVQLFTPCTCGNGWMKILDWDKFALSLYDKKNLTGYRVWMDLEKLSAFPNIYNWYMRLVEKKDLPLSVLNQDILSAGRNILRTALVRITRYYGKNKKGEIRICPVCLEAYPVRQGLHCLACQGEGYFDYDSLTTLQGIQKAVCL